MDVQLKDCPFCGNIPHSHAFNMGGHNEGFVPGLACSCGASVNTGYRPESAVDRWNSRPREEALQDVAEALQELNVCLTTQVAALVGLVAFYSPESLGNETLRNVNISVIKARAKLDEVKIL